MALNNSQFKSGREPNTHSITEVVARVPMWGALCASPSLENWYIVAGLPTDLTYLIMEFNKYFILKVTRCGSKENIFNQKIYFWDTAPSMVVSILILRLETAPALLHTNLFL